MTRFWNNLQCDFYLYVATFQQHLHMEYIYLSWSDIPELVIPMMISLIEANKEATEQGFLMGKLKSSSFTVPTMTWPNDGIYCVTNDHGYVPFDVVIIRSYYNSWVIFRFLTRVTRQVQHVEQELLTLSEQLSWSPVICGFVLLDHCLSFKSFSYSHCIICVFATYGFWLPFW